MRRGTLGISLLMLVAGSLATGGCSSTVTNPAPSLNSVSPTNALAGSAGFTLTVNGRNFLSGVSVVLWNGSPRTTTFISGASMQAIINPSDLAVAGAVPVTVFTQGPGGGTSNAVSFTVNPQPSPVPTITSLSPAGTFAGGPSFNLTVNGTNFVNGSTVLFNNGNRFTSFLNSTQLQATILSTDIQTAGTGQVAVLNPAPGGGASNSLPFAIPNPPPTINSFSPASQVAGGANFTLAVLGSGFVCATFSGTTCSTSATVVNWDGSSRTTTFVNSAQVTAAIPATDLVAAKTVQVTVTNPTPGGGTSPPAAYSVIPGASGAGLPELVDVSTNGAQANRGIGNLSSSGPVTAGNGRFIAFASISDNLVANDNNGVADIFLRDTCLGVTAGCIPQTLLVSQTTNGVLSNGPSLEPSISSTGRFVAFSSTATNLVSGATTGVQQVYLRDTCVGVSSGCTPQTTLVSVATDGMSPSNAPSLNPFLSPDGQFVAFASSATNLVSGVATGAQEIYLRNTCAGLSSGCTPATTVVTLAADGRTPADGSSSQPVVGTGGRFVAFSSTATNLVAIASGAVQQIYLRDTCTGVVSGCMPGTALVSIGADGVSAGGAASSQPSSSTDGRFVAFSSTANNLISGVSSTFRQIYLRDTCTGVSGSCTARTSLVSIATDANPGLGDSAQPSVSSNGRFVALNSAAANLVATDTNGFQDVFVRDTCAGASGCTPRTVLASLAADGRTQGNGNSFQPAIGADGHFVAFISAANNLVSNDTTPAEDIFLAITTF